MATQWTLPQGDLFEPSPPMGQLMETERRKALDLLQALLAEAMTLHAGDGDQEPSGGAR